MITKQAYDKGEKLKVVGIIRPNKNSVAVAYDFGVVYTPELMNYILEKNDSSQLSQYLLNNTNVNPFTGEEYISNSNESKEIQYEKALKKYGVDKTPTRIRIYPVNYEAKEKIKLQLDEYNDLQKENDKIKYTDYMAMIINVLSFLVEGVTNVVIVMSTVSLLVSSIMIAIITYVSVIERVKEIGILRSIGARKKDISRMFNVETLIIGFFSGIIGVLIGGLITIPVNIFIGNSVIGLEKIALFKMENAILLILISILASVLSGYIPSIIASKQSPTNALRKND